MNKITGKNLINGNWTSTSDVVRSVDLAGVAFFQAGEKEAAEAAGSARADFRKYNSLPRSTRALFLRSIADEIDAAGDAITETAQLETGLPEARLIGERGRTTGQLNMFADLLDSGDYLDTRITKALPDRKPLPRVDIRLTHVALGPVVVFGASNFPLAFSVAGGDTASALAAGCPVIVKGHGAHAGTSELVAQAISRAVQKHQLPAATFQMLQGSGKIVGQALVARPEIKAVGFTGSLKAGRVLHDICRSRAHPIPFYGELGSINPVFILEQAAAKRIESIAEGWANSLLMGCGQFCTNPGVVFVVKGAHSEQFKAATVAVLQSSAKQKMLTDAICNAYKDGIEKWGKLAQELVVGSVDERHALPGVFCVNTKTWMNTPELREEIFGPAGIIVECDDLKQILAMAEALEGQLTATIQMDDADMSMAQKLLVILEEKAGRILCNGFPTGVEVCDAMMHGGPYPSSTDVRATSVGSLAITRWLRPVSYQNFPAMLLLEEVRNL